MPPVFSPVIQDPSLPRAIIVDIDGTVAHMNGRSPYDYSMVHTDTPDDSVFQIIQALRYDIDIIFVS